MGTVIPPGQAKYPPELLCHAQYTNVNAGAEAKILELKDFAKRQAHVLGIAGANVADVALRLTTEKFDEFDVPSFGTIDRTEEFDRFAKNLVKLAVYNGSVNNLTGDAPNPAYKSRLLVSYFQPTIIEKIRRGVSLTSEERALSEKWLAQKRVDFGLAPEFNPINAFNIDARTVIDKVAVADEIDITAGGSAEKAQTLGEYIDVGDDEVFILYELSTDGALGNPSDGLKLRIRRDGQDVMQVDNFAMPAIERSVPLWIPALNHLHVEAWATLALADFNFVYKYAKCRLSLIDKARWLEKGTIDFVDDEHRQLFDTVREKTLVGLPVDGFDENR